MNRIRLGIPSLLEFRTAAEHVRFCAENGFVFFEINLSFPWFQSDRIDVAEFTRLSREFGVGYTLHLHDQLNPFDFSPEIRNGSLQSVIWALGFAKSIGADRITMHLVPGMYSSIDGIKVYAYEKCCDEYIEHVEEFAGLCEEKLKGTSIVFCIENTNGFLPFHKKAMEKMLAHECFGLTFDVGHSYKSGGGDEDFILSHRDRLRHFHLHDVSDKGNHLALGRGVVDIPRYIRLIEQTCGQAVLEVKESSAILESKTLL